MAAKSKAAAKGRKGAAGKVANKAKGRPKGLQLTTAQQAAYNKAFSATAQRLSNAAHLRAAATGFRKYRLQAANATIRKAKIYEAKAQAASIAAYAARRSLQESRLAHQNAALQHRIGMDTVRHTTLLGRAQFARSGVARYAHKAVMRTVTQAAAVNHEAQFIKRLARTAKKAGRRGRPKGKGTPLSRAILKASQQAGSAAAARIPGNAATQRARARNRRSNARGNAASAKATAKRAKTRTAPILNWAAYAAAHAGQAKFPVKTEPSGPWLGDEVTPNCIVIAVANHLLIATGCRVKEADLTELTEECGPEPTIEEVLWKVWLTGWPFQAKFRLRDYRKIEIAGDDYDPHCVIGYETQTDDGPADHCALTMTDGKVLSWGSIRDRDGDVEEAWNLTWQG